MKALWLEAIGQLRLVTVAEPKTAEEEILVKTGAATICTSDLNDIRENPFGIKLPVVMGHEGAGVVAEVGRAVRNFKVGDRIAAHPVHPCKTCVNCRNGLGHLCFNMRHFGFNMPGTFAEYFIVREDRARVLPKGVDFAVAALTEPVCVCLESLEQARLKKGDSLLIFGDGPFGVLTARLAQTLSLTRVVLVGHHEFRLSFAGQNVVTVNTRDKNNYLEVIRDVFGGNGCDAIILAVGDVQAVRDGLQLLKPRGRLVVFSAISGEVPVDLFRVQFKELEIIGACNDKDLMDKAIGLLADSRVGLKDLITHRFSLDDYQKAFALADKGKNEALKVSFLFG